MFHKKSVNNLPIALSNSCKSIITNIASGIGDYSINYYGLLSKMKGFPIITQTLNLYRVYNICITRSRITKLCLFYNELNNIPELERYEMIEKFISDEEYARKTLEDISIILADLFEEEYSSLLGKVFVSLLSEDISKLEFRRYASVIDSLFPGDYEILKNGEIKIVELMDCDASYLRLVSLGLMCEYSGKNTMLYSYTNGNQQLHETLNPENHYIKLTDFGRKFINITTINNFLI